jgi:NitT/TauT family transport system substrate-binding protein
MKLKNNKVVVVMVISLLVLFMVVMSAFAQESSDVPVKVGAMKGPTGMGLVGLMESRDYAFTLTGTPDEIVAGLVSGSLDIAAVPCNLASVLNARTEGDVKVVAVNTLGVLYILELGDSIHSIADLKGKTLYTTGKGTSPDYVIRYILTENGLDPDKDLQIEFKSEAAEVAAMFTSGTEMIALLPQPYVTTVMAQNPEARIALDVTEEWQKVNPDTSLITGCVVLRDAFAKENKDKVSSFLKAYEASVKSVNEDPAAAALLIEEYGIIAKAAIAQKAIPLSNITLITGDEMQKLVEGYLTVLNAAEPKSIGGKLPDASFYYKE